MENLYGLPVIHDQEALSIVPAWSLQLARVLAARDAAIVAATGAVPEGNPNTTAGLATRMAVAEATIDALDPDPWIDLPLTSPWVPYSTDGSYYPGVRARRVPAGVQIQGMVKGGGTNTEICTLPTDLIPEHGGHFPAISNAAAATVFISASGQLRYLSGGSSAAYVSVNLIIPMTGEALDPSLPELPAHEHVIADVTGLQAALDGKAGNSHTHSIGSVTGLQTALNGKVDDTDPRLSNARTPTAHQHAVADVDGLTARLAALEYNSGPRDLSKTLRNGWAGTISVQRIGASVSLYFENLSSANATSTVFLTLPSGFRAPARPGARVHRTMITAGGVPPVMRQADIDSYGHCRIFTTTGVTETFSGSLEFATTDPIPTTPPGDPA